MLQAALAGERSRAGEERERAAGERAALEAAMLRVGNAVPVDVVRFVGDYVHARSRRRVRGREAQDDGDAEGPNAKRAQRHG